MDIIKYNKFFMVFSLIIIVFGLIMLGVNGFNEGIDFRGGTLIQIKIEKFVPVEEIREIMDLYDKNASILHAGINKDEVIIKSTFDFSNEEITNIINLFINKYNLEKDNFQSKKFGATMGTEIKRKALISIAIATSLMLIYISWRFELTFGIAAIIALIHDILIMVSVYAILRIPVNSSFIVAILTILGYSINDTIVIYDRIRENLKLYPKEKLENIINNSIKQSFARTINTSLTTLGAVVVIYLLGVEDIKVLALPLIIGIISGTYSSLFIASPFWYYLKSHKTKAA